VARQYQAAYGSLETLASGGPELVYWPALASKAVQQIRAIVKHYVAKDPTSRQAVGALAQATAGYLDLFKALPHLVS
jgi:hypothetical protein